MPAAFRRLCVETIPAAGSGVCECGQPPSGGCVLKHWKIQQKSLISFQPPSGGCVLKPCLYQVIGDDSNQPPSGGCVLKHHWITSQQRSPSQPPSGGCVLKQLQLAFLPLQRLPAAFRRLCVETPGYTLKPLSYLTSRLQAAVC